MRLENTVPKSFLGAAPSCTGALLPEACGPQLMSSKCHLRGVSPKHRPMTDRWAQLRATRTLTIALILGCAAQATETFCENLIHPGRDGPCPYHICEPGGCGRHL